MREITEELEFTNSHHKRADNHGVTTDDLIDKRSR